MDKMENDKTRQQIINEIHEHIPFFREHWETFCRMVEDHGEHVEECRNDPACVYDTAEYYRREEHRHELARDLRELGRKYADAMNTGRNSTAKHYDDLIIEKKTAVTKLKSDPDPPEPDCVKYWQDNFQYTTIPFGPVFWIRPGPVNPLLWFGLFGNQGIQREPTDEERLIYYCALLSILHDCEDEKFLEWSEEHIFRKDDYKSTYFIRENFCWAVFDKKLKGSGGEGLIKRAYEYVKPAIQELHIEPEKPGEAEQKEKIKAGDFDVFLCHNSEDKAAVKRIGELLKERGILPWLDEWELRPGVRWQRALEEEIKNVKSAAVFVGKSGLGPWQDVEQEAFVRQFVKRGCPVIPVILRRCGKEPELPLFLEAFMWVDFRKKKP